MPAIAIPKRIYIEPVRGFLPNDVRHSLYEHAHKHVCKTAHHDIHNICYNYVHCRFAHQSKKTYAIIIQPNVIKSGKD